MAATRIMILIDWYLPGTKAGGPVRSVYSLVQLLKSHYKFYIITSSYDLGAVHPYPDIQTDQLLEKEGVAYYYSSERKISAKQILQLISRVRPHLLYLNSFWSSAFSINILRLQKKRMVNVPVLLAPRGMLGAGALNLKALKKKSFLLIAKMLGLYQKLTFHATQQQEANDILNVYAKAKIIIAPNLNAAVPAENLSHKKKGHLKLFFLSRISKVKNLHYALEVLHRVPASLQIDYDIFGNVEDNFYWENCKKQIGALPPNIRVTYKGELGFNQIQDNLRHYHALFLPTLNENFGHSIVESLMCGCPVIISDQTPWNDVSEAGGYALPLSEPDRFVKAIQALADADHENFRRLSTSAIDYIVKKTDLVSAEEQYKTLFDGAIKN